MNTLTQTQSTSAAIRIVTEVVRWLVGVLFIFSGLIKLNDPVGTQIKLTEYFEVFSGDVPALAGFFHLLISVSLVLAVLFCVSEVVLGVALLAKYRLRITLWVLLGLIVFFTFLTFYSAYFNKVTDCGCFGDAIKLTPWQSFSKDVILLMMIGWLLVNRKYLGNADSHRWGKVVFTSIIVSFAVAYYAIYYLPIIDFLPYQVGASIPANMQLPPGAKPDVYETRYTLQHATTGESKELSDKEYLRTNIWKDTTWQITATSEPVLIQRGARPKITDFSVSALDGQDLTPEVFRGHKLLIIIGDVRKPSDRSMHRINELVRGLTGTNVQPLVLTAADEASFEGFRHQHQLAVPYYLTDATVLKTMIRTTPGILLLKDGVVLEKWPAAAIPDAETVQKYLL